MDIIINNEDHTWRALQGLTPTNEELAVPEDNVYQVDWIRIYKPIAEVFASVTGVSLDRSIIDTEEGSSFILSATVIPECASNPGITWSSDNPAVATVDDIGIVRCISQGQANIIVTTEENHISDTCIVNINGGMVAASIYFDDESNYLNQSFLAGDELSVSCNFHAGSGNTIVDGSFGGVKFWLREIRPGWSVANDYVFSDSTSIGKESGIAHGEISLVGVPSTSEIPTENWYFLSMLS
jgi:hypothetical protein